MNNLCSKISYFKIQPKVLFIFSLLAFSFCLLFGISGHAKATESLYYEQTIDDGYVADGGAETTQTFTASSTNISKIELTFGSQAGAGNACFALCEVPAVNTSDSNYLSIGTPMIDYCSDTPVHPDHTSVSGNTITYTWDSPYPTTVGHYYMFVQNIASCGGHVLPEYGATGNFFGGTWCYGGSCEKHNGGDLVFKAYSNPAPTVSGTVYWAGVGTQYGKIGDYWSIPFYWNVCDSYAGALASGTVAVAAFPSNGSGEAPYKQLIDPNIIGPQKCSGIDTIIMPVETSFPLSGTTTIQLIDNIANYEQGTEIIYTESAPFNYNINYGGDSGNYINYTTQNPMYVGQTIGTTTINFEYNLTGLSYSGGKICAYNYERGLRTDYCSDTLITATSTGQIEIPNNANNIMNIKLVLYSASDYPLLSSDPLMIVWFNQNAQGIASSTMNSLWLDTHSLACTEEEWNEGSGWTFFNFTKLKCRTIKTGLDIANGISQMVMGFINIAVNGLAANIFPLNVPIKMRDSWLASANTTLPSELSWLDAGDAQGNVYLTIPNEWVEATSTAAIWGPAIFEDNNSVKVLFQNIRAISTYAIWIILIAYIIKVGMMLYEEFLQPKRANFGLMDINVRSKNTTYHWHALDDE